MTLIVRDFRVADAEAVAEARRAAWPYGVSTAEGVAWEVAHAPAGRRHRLLVAEAGGTVVGTAATGMCTAGGAAGHAFAEVRVHPAHRRRGVGTALLHHAEEHLAGLGTTAVHIRTLDERPCVTFAERRGYRRAAGYRFWRLDPAAAAPAAPRVPPGVELRTAADLAGDPRGWHTAETEVARGRPGGVDGGRTRVAGATRSTRSG
ncbi:GNAT family N-acetyltransferase [Streptomyces pactum]|uniref:GNAT family N-acetyltransferase n=1 Tax=Streptomyces pactum TaxID=68249 RepID=A0ABS0NG27_9ACTN|nr:GNAT family N-acetyltransferase [Streptomyces pactum]MBH5334126.1 GNAT family N-acetyltransferase [Streptomyces pactum]